jgi:SAM-dependent methyltransferase
LIVIPTAKQHWERNPEIASQDQWTGNQLIGEAVHRRMSGGESSRHWLQWLMQDYFAGRRFSRVLSPGCGTGDHEVAMMSYGTIDQLDAFDFSEASLRLGRQKAAAKNVRINFYVDDLNSFEVPAGRKYDLILCSGSLHHVRELERFFRIMRDALAPQGLFVFNEYVGPCYNVYPKYQLDVINRLLQALAPQFRRADRLEQMTVEHTISIDASESVRSSLILPFAASYFDFEFRRAMGGTILHPLYPLLDHRSMSERTPEIESIIRLLVEFEAILVEEGVLQTDFALCVCRNKSFS